MWAGKQTYVYTPNQQPVVGSQESTIFPTHSLYALIEHEGIVDLDFEWDMIDRKTEKEWNLKDVLTSIWNEKSRRSLMSD